MKWLLVLLALTLAACAPKPNLGIAPPAQMPALPQSLAERAKPLPPLTGKTLGEREQEDAQADIQYNAMGTQLNAIIDAWECVRKTLNSRSKDAAKCFK